VSMHRGNYEPKAALVELGVGRKRARRKWSNGNWGAPSLVGPVRVCEQQLERERELRDERRGHDRERGEQTYWAPQA
jgi:hypothetical protein